METEDLITRIHALIDATKHHFDAPLPPSHSSSGPPLWTEAIRQGEQQSFILLRQKDDDPDAFLGMLFQQRSGRLSAQLWVSTALRDDAENWRAHLREQFPDTPLSIRTPRNPLTLAQSSYSEVFHVVNFFLDTRED